MRFVDVAAEVSNAPTLDSVVSGRIGAFLGAAAVLLGGYLTDRRRESHENRARWARDIVELAMEMILSVERVLDNRVNPHRPGGDIDDAARELIFEEEQERQARVTTKFRVMAPPRVAGTARDLQVACFQLAYPKRRPLMPSEAGVNKRVTYADVLGSKSAFIEAVREGVKAPAQ